MIMLSLCFIHNNLPMEALTTSSGNECGTVSCCRKRKKKTFAFLTRDTSCLEKPNGQEK